MVANCKLKLSVWNCICISGDPVSKGRAITADAFESHVRRRLSLWTIIPTIIETWAASTPHGRPQAASCEARLAEPSPIRRC